MKKAFDSSFHNLPMNIERETPSFLWVCWVYVSQFNYRNHDDESDLPFTCLSDLTPECSLRWFWTMRYRASYGGKKYQVIKTNQGSITYLLPYNRISPPHPRFDDGNEISGRTLKSRLVDWILHVRWWELDFGIDLIMSISYCMSF